LRRLLKDPFRTSLFYCIALFARIHPYKIHARTLWNDTMTYFLPEGQAIYYYGFFEANLTNFLINFLQEGDTFVDIGAHVGYYSVLSSRLVGDSGHVHSFEPTPRTFISLEENTRHLHNVSINNVALLNEEKEIEFIDYGPKNSAFNGFKRRISEEMNFLKKDDSAIKVKAIALDSYCRKNNLQPTFIKIDAEGAESLILSGMTYVMSELRPIISIEVAGGEEWKANCKNSIEMLLSHDFVAYESTLVGGLKKHVQQVQYKYDNLICIPKEKEEEVVTRMLKY